MLIFRTFRAYSSVPLAGAVLGAVLVSAPASGQFRRNTNTGVILYADPNFRGASRAVNGDVADLRPVGLNDQVTSIEIPQGETWEICQDVNYGNACATLSGSVADLRTMGWDDRISSLRRVDGRFGYGTNRNGRSGDFYSQSQDVTFYDRTGYRGAAYDQGSLGNRVARSVEVRGGTWELCDRAGRCSTVNESVSDLSRLGLSGQIISVRPVNNQAYGRRRNSQDRYYGGR